MSGRIRIAAAVLVAATLLASIAGDLWDSAFRSWWAHHSLTGDMVSSLLVVGVTGLIFDELVARRQRKDRGLTVSVQALIVYNQTRRVYDATMANTDAEDRRETGEDLRSLANMLLTAGPSFFDDPQARQFLEQVERMAALIYRFFTSKSASSNAEDIRRRLKVEMEQLKTVSGPLIARIPGEEWSMIRQTDPAYNDGEDSGSR